MIRLSLFSILTALSKGHERTVRAKKNIFISFFIKGFSIFISFLMVPLTLTYLDTINYGIWITLISIVQWFGFFDIGLGNGLRNKFAEALAKGDKDLAKTYVSTSYVLLTIIFSLIIFFFLIVNNFLNWASILNAPRNLDAELSNVVIVVFVFFTLRFILQLISVILLADQRTALSNVIVPLSNFFTLIGIYILMHIEKGSLLHLSIISCVVPVLLYTLASFLLFNKDYKPYSPSIKNIDFSYTKTLMGLSIQFFIILFVAFILYSTSNIIITQLYGPGEVTPFNIVFKYFSITTMVFTIILTPFWSGFTEAYNKSDFKWIEDVMHKLFYVRTAMFVLIVIMILSSTVFYGFWIGTKIKITFVQTLLFGLYSAMIIWNMPFVYFMNGVSKIRIQLIYSILAAIVHIPLSVFLCKICNIGSSGVIFSLCLVSIPTLILWPIQYKMIINNKLSSIWAK